MTIRATITRIVQDRRKPHDWRIVEHTNGTATLHVHDEAEEKRQGHGSQQRRRVRMGRQMIRLPVTRGDCLPGGPNEARPCPHRRCKWHLDRERRWMERVADWSQSCVLDVADAGGHTLEEVADLFGVSRERIRQIEEGALDTMRTRIDALEPPALRDG